MAGKPWDLLGFMPALKQWVEYDEPPGDLLVKVAGFGEQLERDPETDAIVEHANLRFRTMPGTEHDGWIVSITYALFRSRDPRFAGEVRCQEVCCVRHPQQELIPRRPVPRHH